MTSHNQSVDVKRPTGLQLGKPKHCQDPGHYHV